MTIARGPGRRRLLPHRLHWQIAWTFAPLGIAGVVLMGLVGYRLATESLRQHTLQRLESVADGQGRELEHYFDGLRAAVVRLASDRHTAAVLKEFLDATTELDQDPISEPTHMRSQMLRLKGFLEEYYRGEIGTGAVALRSLLLPQRSAVWLQAAYLGVVNPPFRDDLAHAPRYARYHAATHPVLAAIVAQLGLADLYLADINSGRLLYTTAKAPDFQTNLLDGPYARSGLGRLFRQLQTADPRSYAIVDFSEYLPAHGRPSLFIGSPVFEDGTRIGALIVQVSADRINNIVSADGQWARLGLGETGEVYLVGRGPRDPLMRSDSRFLEQLRILNPTVAERGTRRTAEKGTVPLQDADCGPNNQKHSDQSPPPGQGDCPLFGHTSSILTQPIRSAAWGRRDAAHSGTYISYRGLPVLGATRRLATLHGLDWTVVAEMSAAEAWREAAHVRHVLMGAGGAAIAVIVLLTVLFSTSLSAPARALAAAAQDVEQGGRFPNTIRGSGEFNILGGALHRMADENVALRLQEREDTRQLKGEIADLLGTIRAALGGDLTRRATSDAPVLGGLSNALNLLLENVAGFVADVSEASAEATKSAIEVRTAATKLAGDVTRQTTDLTGAVRALEELAGKASTLAQQASETAGRQHDERATSQLLELTHTLAGQADSVCDTTQSLTLRLKHLGERAMEVSAATASFREASTQAHMLALNVAIEASRTEHALGLPDVANDARKLAACTDAIIGEIIHTVAAIQDEAAESAVSMERAGIDAERQATSLAGAKDAVRDAHEASVQRTAVAAEVCAGASVQARLLGRVADTVAEITERSRHTELSAGRMQENGAALIGIASRMTQRARAFLVEHDVGGTVTATRATELHAHDARGNGRGT